MDSDVLLSNYSHMLGLKVCVVIPGSRVFSYNTKLMHRPRVMLELIHTVCPWLPLLSAVDGLFPCLDFRGWNGLPLSHLPSTGSSLSYQPSAGSSQLSPLCRDPQIPALHRDPQVLHYPQVSTESYFLFAQLISPSLPHACLLFPLSLPLAQRAAFLDFVIHHGEFMVSSVAAVVSSLQLLWLF